jgi:hypothetical protein
MGESKSNVRLHSDADVTNSALMGATPLASAMVPGHRALLTASGPLNRRSLSYEHRCSMAIGDVASELAARWPLLCMVTNESLTSDARGAVRCSTGSTAAYIPLVHELKYQNTHVQSILGANGNNCYPHLIQPSRNRNQPRPERRHINPQPSNHRSQLRFKQPRKGILKCQVTFANEQIRACAATARRSGRQFTGIPSTRPKHGPKPSGSRRTPPDGSPTKTPPLTTAPTLILVNQINRSST